MSGCGRRGPAAGRSALLPPRKLLPDRQPAYVTSWVYIFGVASLAALGVVLASGGALALGGPDWWHTNPVGHFFNSLHLWSVELFMAMLVIHLWGKFWMAAWRGRRAATWITGVVAFLASVLVCFTGYLSQQNLDSQWIATNGKDAFNAVGIGAFFNLMNFGQMLMWHIVILPIVLIALIGAHVLLVRHRGVSHPLPATRPTWRERRGRPRRRPGALARPDQALRHPEGRHHRRRDRAGADLHPGRPAVLAGRAAGHGGLVGEGRPRRLPRHRRQRAERHQPDRDLRASVQHQRNPAERMVRPGELGRRAAAHRPGAELRDHAAHPGRRHQPGGEGRAGRLQRRARQPAEPSGPPTTSTRWPRSSSSTGCRWSRAPTTVRSRPCSPPSWPWPRAARSTPTCSPSGRSTAPTSPGRCCSWRTVSTTPTSPPPIT